MLAVVAAAGVVGGGAGGRGQDPPLQRVEYVAPVPGPVADPFRPPIEPYGRGNLGLDYDTVPGESVTAAAAGVVTFAGQVGGDLHVTIQHADRLRTTYAFLSTVSVAAGESVASGDEVGTAGEQVHLSARLGDAYLDPQVLLDASAPTGVRLVPDEP